jgi:2-oxoglutarate ferredoxin oxidoreductase subunit alpha
VLVPELNNGQLVRILRANYLVDAQSTTKIKGLPFTARELEEAIQKELAR